MLAVGARSYWIAGAFALLVSQAVIFSAWRDAWAGTAAIVLLLSIRARSEPDGTFASLRFSTPVRDYRDFGPVRLMSFGEARWLLADGEFTYGEFNLVDITYNRR